MNSTEKNGIRLNQKTIIKKSPFNTQASPNTFYNFAKNGEINKRKKQAAFLSVGLDDRDYRERFSDVLIWGEKSSPWVSHKLMTLDAYNRNAGIFIEACLDFHLDPFTGKVLNDFDRVCLEPYY